MAVEIVVPVLGESVTEATVAQWLKKPGEAVAQDEPLVELETDKVTLEVGAPANGVVAAVSAEEGATVEVGAVLGLMEEGDAPAAAAARQRPRPRQCNSRPLKSRQRPRQSPPHQCQLRQRGLCRRRH